MNVQKAQPKIAFYLAYFLQQKAQGARTLKIQSIRRIACRNAVAAEGRQILTD